MASVIVEEINKRVSRPIAAINHGEIYFDHLPETGDAAHTFLREGTGGGHIDLIRTKVGIDMWVNDDYLTTHADDPNPIASTFALALGGWTTGIYGPVILAGNNDVDTVPLTDHQLGHVVRLAVTINIPIVIVTR